MATTHVTTDRILKLLLGLGAVLSLLLLVWRFSPVGPGFKGSNSFARAAQDVIQDGDFDAAMRPPAYPLFLSASMELFPVGWEVGAALFQVGLGLLICVALLSATKNLGGGALSAVIALILYFSHLLFQVEVTALRDTTLFTLLLVGFVFIVPLSFESKGVRHCALATVVAAAFLTRASSVVLLPILLLIIAWDNRSSFSSVAKGLIVPVLLFCVLVSPWLRVVSHLSGAVSFSPATASGQNLWKGNNKFFFDIWPTVDLDELDPYLAAGGKGDFESAAVDQKMKQQAIRYIENSPWLFVESVALKFIAFFNPIPTPLGTAELIFKNGRVQVVKFDWRNPILLVTGTLHFLIIFPAWIGFLMTRRASSARERQIATVSVLVTLFFAAIHSVFFPDYRYRLPIDVMLIPFAACFLGELVVIRVLTEKVRILLPRSAYTPALRAVE